MFENQNALLKKNLANIPGWQTNRKIVVIESDDWGCVRMPSREVYEKLLKEGIRVDKCPYNRYDSLASEEDLTSLFEVLVKFKDKNGNHPIITANTVVANPDFAKIQASGFLKYYYEPFTETLQRYPNHKKAFELWNQGITNKMFFPQFHGREHLNVHRWLNQLQKGTKETRYTFSLGLFGISTDITTEDRKSYMAALDFENYEEIKWQKNMLAEGIDMFERIFKYKPSSFIATNYTWHSELETTLAERGIHFIQSAGYQIEPNISGIKVKRHFIGQRNKLKQIYLTRNCIFEPSLNNNIDSVSACIKEIKMAFFWQKPAIISSHRLNYIGFIDENNRKKNLKGLKVLLKRILHSWPDVEFFTTSNLGNIIRDKLTGNDGGD